MCYSYQLIYLAVPFFKKIRPHGEAVLHNYAVLISARNEERVIAHLLESIRAQDYPAHLVTTFVVADNCTDDTAAVAREHGAVVYERRDCGRTGKGYALNYLLGCIRARYGEDRFDGFFVFDADNLLSTDFISQMNRTFSDGYKIITSYRNSKNYGANWISAGYAHWFLREAKYLNHPRMALGTSCAVSGTGFVFSADILKKCGGWNFFLLTEDIEFTVHSIVCGEVIGYCPDAVLYDEQPTRFAQSWRQRKRWARGYLQVYGKYSRKLLCGIFRGSYSCFDALMSIMPALLLSVFGLSFNLAMGVLGLITNQDVMPAVISSLKSFGSSYLLMFGIGILTTVTEWKQIHTTTPKKLFYTLTFPVFMFTYIPIALSALFGKVEWKPIEHRVSVSLEELLR